MTSEEQHIVKTEEREDPCVEKHLEEVDLAHSGEAFIAHAHQRQGGERVHTDSQVHMLPALK